MGPLILLCAVGGVVVLDYSIVFVAIPSIQADLAVAPAVTPWLANSYALAFGALLLLGGRLGDHLGRRRVLLAGLGLFTASSLALALAPDVTTFVAGRVVQGVGAALLAPAALALLTVIHPTGPARTRAVGAYGAVAGAAGAAGTLLGGALTQLASWHWAFLINVPLGIAAVALTPRLLPADGPVPDLRRVLARLDLPGAVTVTAGLFATVLGITGLEHAGLGSAETLVPLAVGLALIAVFLVVEHRAAHPLMPLSIFRLRGVAVGNGTYLIVGAGTFGALFLLSLYFQQVRGYDALVAGLAVLPLAVGSLLASAVAAYAVGRFGTRSTVVAGFGALAVGLLMLSGIGPTSPYATTVLPGELVTAVALGLVVVPLTAMATDDVPPDRAGLASGLFSTAQELGGALGLAVLTAVAGAVARHGVERGVGPLDAQVAGLRIAFQVAAGLAAAAMAVAWFVGPRAPVPVTARATGSPRTRPTPDGGRRGGRTRRGRSRR